MIAPVGLNLAELSRIATTGLVAAVWQGVLLSAFVALGLRMLPKAPAAVRFAIWFGVFALVAALPVAGLFRHETAAAGHAPWLTVDSRWCLIVAGAWGMASLMRAATLLLAAFRVRALWKRAIPVDRQDGRRHADATRSRHAELCICDEVDRPTVIGFFSPRILIPSWLVEKLTAVELDQIVLHETSHLARADDWMNLLQKVALVVFPLNPALAWVERRLCFERELACDERVLQATGAPKAYAECLASLAEHRLWRRGSLTLALGALGRQSELGQRVGRILRRRESMRPLHARLVLGGAMLALLTAAAGLERCPQVVGFASPQTMTAAAPMPEAVIPHHLDSLYKQVVFRVPAREAQGCARTTKPLPKAASSPVIVPAYHDRAVALRSATRVGQVRATNVSEISSQASPAMVQWIVVMSWQRSDGARMVFASEQVSDSAGRVVRMQSDTEPAPAQDQVHPYAAVPVRDGWLVFQL
jgi:beta-lactamase regulating signal transducer with metallopeptidase domain